MLPYALIHKSICQTLKVTSLICISSTNRSFKKLISKSLLNSCPKRRLNPQSVKGLIYLPMAKYWDNWYLMANLRFFSENSKKKTQKFEKPSNLPLLDNKTIPPRRICRSSPRQVSRRRIESFSYIAHQLISTCTTAVGRAHISCYASAQQLLCGWRHRHLRLIPLILPATSKGNSEDYLR